MRAAHLQAVTQQRLATLPLDRTFTLLGEPALVIDRALGPPALAAQIHQWLTESDLESPDQSRLMELARQALTANRDRSPELVWDRHCLRAWNGLIVRVIDPASSQLFPSEVIVGEPAEGEWGRLDWQPVNDGIGLAGEMRLRAELSGGLASMSLPNRPAKPVAKWLQELRIPPWWRGHLPVLARDSVPVWLFSAGPLQGLESSGAKAAEAGLKPIWRLFNAV